MTVPPVIPISPGQVACRKGDHQEGNDPRMAGLCVRCGKPLVERDKRLEDLLLREAVESAARRYGTDSAEFVAAVQRRLETGQELYGNSSLYKTVEELCRELREEAQDIGAWGAILAQKIMGHDDEFDSDDDRTWHLLEALIHAVAADWHLRRLAEA